MKVFRIILLTLCVLVSLFFVVFANIQTDLAKEAQAMAHRLASEAEVLKESALKEAANAREAEAEAMLYKIELEKCKGSK